MDEMRAGTRTECKRRWTPKGHRPVCKVKIGYEFTYLYAAIAPFSGDIFAMLLPDMKAESFNPFVQQFALHRSQETLLFLDQASSHQIVPDAPIRMEHLPPKCPELNPVERFFKELRKEMANQLYQHIAAVEDKIIKLILHFMDEPAAVINLTLFPYMHAPFVS